MTNMDRKKKNKRGRPPIEASQRRNVVTSIRLRQDEFEQLSSDAKAAGMTMADYLRYCWQKVRE
jgi:hypothetical protein